MTNLITLELPKFKSAQHQQTPLVQICPIVEKDSKIDPIRSVLGKPVKTRRVKDLYRNKSESTNPSSPVGTSLPRTSVAKPMKMVEYIRSVTKKQEKGRASSTTKSIKVLIPSIIYSIFTINLS